MVKHGAVKFQRSGSNWLLRGLPTVIIQTFPIITRKKVVLHQHIFVFLCQGDQNGKDAVTNQLRLSEIPPAEKTENSSVD